MGREEFSYIIDSEDIIRSCELRGSDQNSWNQGGDPHLVEGESIWRFIDGSDARFLFEELFKKVREGHVLGPIPFRCDSDQEKVFMELFLKPLGEKKIEVNSCFVRAEPRDRPIQLFDKSVPRSNQIVTLCSMCKKVKESDSSWIEVEEAIKTMKLFEEGPCPQLSHGLCKTCGRAILNAAGLSPDWIV